MANVTTVFETKLENYTDVANQAFTGRIDVAAVVGDTELPIPTSSSDGFPFSQRRPLIACKPCGIPSAGSPSTTCYVAPKSASSCSRAEFRAVAPPLPWAR